MLNKALLLLIVASCRQDPTPSPRCSISVERLPNGSTRVTARWTCPGYQAAAWHLVWSDGHAVTLDQRVLGKCPDSASFVAAGRFPLELSQLEIEGGPMVPCL